MGLFEEFDKVNHQDWIEKINIDLKGKDYQDTLVWNSEEGIDVQPFYTENSDLTLTPIKLNNTWKIRETILITTYNEANKKALLALKGGANSILFLGEIKGQTEMSTLLKGIQIDIIDLHFYNSNPKHTARLINLNQGSISFDFLSEDGNIEELIELTSTNSTTKSITIKHSFNVSIIEELATSLSKGAEYLNKLTDKGIEAVRIADKMQFTFGVSTNYFFEIAKLRAARKLWVLILEQYNVEDSPMTIHSDTSLELTSEEDENYDILRNTTKAMSAIIGGCDSLTVQPHNIEKLDFSNRVARNIQHILKEESFFNKVNNPADGAYYIEELTDKIAEKSWELFQKMEGEGGYVAVNQIGDKK